MRNVFRQGGGLMIEVLITIVIIVIGFVGLMQMQSRLQKSEVESYQRTQALMLAKDMASRLSANRANATGYATATAITEPDSLGGAACPTATATLTERDLKEWCEAIQGAAETEGGSRVGTLINGRGCIYELAGGDEYQVTVVWQGLAPVGNAGPAVACGKATPNPYDGGTDCINDLCRREVSTIVRLGSLPP